MTDGAVALILIAAIPWLLRAMRINEHGRRTLATTRDATGILRNPKLSDLEKEKAARKMAGNLLAETVRLAAIGAIAVGIPGGFLWLLGKAGVTDPDHVIQLSLTWPFLIGGILLGIPAFLPQKPNLNGYSSLERMLHKVATCTRTSQIATADLEDKTIGKQAGALEPNAPVFLTGLPRSGTTLLLELLAKLPEFATHTYRDMPFVLTPCFWETLSGPFRKQGGKIPRAHGDSIEIGFDSPEGFEEVLWKTFHPGHFAGSHIPVTEKVARDFPEFFKNHQKKIRWLRRKANLARYLSKNNGNIGRIRAIAEMQPEATFVIPFRTPLEHAASLRKQHLRFLEIHEKDPFGESYMESIGHHEFGKTLKPINFNGWAEKTSHHPDSINFWVEYWIHAYANLIQHEGKARIVWVDFDQLCQTPAESIQRICGALACSMPDTEEIQKVVPPKEYRENPEEKLAKAAHDLHQKLVALAST